MEEKRLQSAVPAVTDPAIAKILQDIERLPQQSKKQFFKYLWAIYPSEISTHARLVNAVKAAVSEYKGGFFGISAQRQADIAAVQQLCGKAVVHEGRSLELAFEVYKYAKQEIKTGPLGRSDLRDRLLLAIAIADPALDRTIQELAAEDNLTQAGVREAAKDNPSVIQLPLLYATPRNSIAVEGALESSGSFQGGFLPRDDSILVEYRKTAE